ncbi:UNVERIFIED_CONTAM: hypothetical protein Sangu_1008500, partial [Sesamum angustifolium]
KEAKDLMWAATRSFLEDGYNNNKNQINVTNAEAYQWLKQIPPELWCKFKMSDKPKCDMLSNTLSESFNNYIKEAREEPILSLLEMLRRQFMCRFQKKRGWIAKYNGNICHRIQSKLDQIKKNTLNFEAIFAGAGTWEILSDVRKVEVLKEEIVMLPPFKRLPGRPKKLRKKGTDEINIGGRVTKRGSTMTCSKCERSIGHTDTGRGRGTTTDVVGGRKVAAGASRETKTAIDSAATGRGRGRGRGRGERASFWHWKLEWD